MSGGCRLVLLVFISFLFVAAVFAADSVEAPSSSGPPRAEQRPVREVLHGHTITDPYRWLENAKSAETQKWVAEELAYTRSILDPLPGRKEINDRLTQLLSIGTISAPQIGGKFYFYTKREGTQNQPVLYVREGLQGKDRTLVDVNALAPDGTIALDWWQPSDDGKYVAYGTSPSGSELSTLRVIESGTGKLLADSIDRTRAASLVWKLDDSGFYYTRYPKKGEVAAGQENYNRHVFYHALGSDAAKDPLIFGEGRDAQDWPGVDLSNDGRWLIITVEEGFTKTELYLQDLKAGTAPVRITDGKDFLYGAQIVNGTIFITTNEDAPRYRAFSANASAPERPNWKEIIPQTDAVLDGTSVVNGMLLAQYEKNATSQLKLFDTEGKPLGDVELPAIGSVVGTGGKWDRKEVFFAFQSFTIPSSIYQINLSDRSTTMWSKVDSPGIDPSRYEVKQVWFNSKDGTRVPMFVFHKKGLQLNGKNPTLLTGYGGFNLSITPNFQGDRYLWLEHGGVFAVANLRGGSEFGEDWHRAGMLDKKQNVFDDFIAAAEYLIAEKYTDKDHLAIRGGSNGGLLMGAALTQRPDLFRAVVCQVPLLDMLRYQNFEIAKLWIPEYGSADDPKQFDWLYAYSPYHHVKAGEEYPAILFMTADSDTRVDPMHAKKMAALMQTEAANGRSRERPILLRIDTKAGHGAGKPIAKQVEDLTDIYSFLFWQVGTK
ncbi:MAG TPA: prolyl oligopeptidase family serine peptidase [Terriglobales bacterium]|nr:prolyl oligopeptidase family serine peptidase [Terriglobales bacterium]